MAAHSPIGFDIRYLRDQVLQTYDRVAREPDGDFHFHRGPDYASTYLGYDAQELAELPSISTARFAGVGNPIGVGPIHRGETVVDHACGAGMDALLAARRVGPTGRVIGVDMTPAMRACAEEGARLAGLQGVVTIRPGFMEELPLASASVDVLISNGVVNLSPDKRQVFREIVRVLKPGGRLHLADVVVQRELTLAARSNPDLWAACIGGSLPEPELFELTEEAGLVGGAITARHRSFANTSAESKVSPDLRVGGISFIARKAS